jgi:hypothetical protein
MGLCDPSRQRERPLLRPVLGADADVLETGHADAAGQAEATLAVVGSAEPPRERARRAARAPVRPMAEGNRPST